MLIELYKISDRHQTYKIELEDKVYYWRVKKVTCRAYCSDLITKFSYDLEDKASIEIFEKCEVITGKEPIKSFYSEDTNGEMVGDDNQLTVDGIEIASIELGKVLVDWSLLEYLDNLVVEETEEKLEQVEPEPEPEVVEVAEEEKQDDTQGQAL